MGRKIMKCFTVIVAMTFLVSACFLDSDGWIPFWILTISGAWLCGYAYINNFFERGMKKS